MAPRNDEGPLDPIEKICPFSMMREEVRLCCREKCELFIERGGMCSFRVLNQLSYSVRQILEKMGGGRPRE
jgi:hypothetical protein